MLSRLRSLPILTLALAALAAPVQADDVVEADCAPGEASFFSFGDPPQRVCSPWTCDPALASVFFCAPAEATAPVHGLCNSGTQVASFGDGPFHVCAPWTCDPTLAGVFFCVPAEGTAPVHEVCAEGGLSVVSFGADEPDDRFRACLPWGCGFPEPALDEVDPDCVMLP